MRGEILHYDQIQGFGFITGADGNRYTFRREDMRGALPPVKGGQVEFAASRDQARNVSARAGGAVTGPVHQSVHQSPAETSPVGVLPATTTGHFGRNATEGHAGSTDMWSYFREAITTNYANFRGRARRKEYWSYVLFMFVSMTVLMIAAVLVDTATGNFNYDYPTPYFTGGAVGLFTLASIVPSVAISVRRQHDIGLSGWFYLLILLPYLGGLILFVFSLIPSQGRENKWGPVPAGVYIPPYVAPNAPT